MDNYHITPTENGWALKKQGAERASKTATTKVEIIKLATEFLDGKTASLRSIRKTVRSRKSARILGAPTRRKPKASGRITWGVEPQHLLASEVD